MASDDVKRHREKAKKAIQDASAMAVRVVRYLFGISRVKTSVTLYGDRAHVDVAPICMLSLLRIRGTDQNSEDKCGDTENNYGSPCLRNEV